MPNYKWAFIGAMAALNVFSEPANVIPGWNVIDSAFDGAMYAVFMLLAATEVMF